MAARAKRRQRGTCCCHRSPRSLTTNDGARSTTCGNPTILRALANVRVTSIHGVGRVVPLRRSRLRRGGLDVSGGTRHTALGRCDEDEEGVIPETNPRRLTAEMLGAPRGTTFVHAAVGRGHTLLVGSNGDVWSAGVNPLGQVSRSTEVPAMERVFLCARRVF